MKRILMFLLVLGLNTFGQVDSDTLNKFDNKGRKNGYWIRYLDDFIQTTDSTSATYIMYEFYSEGLSNLEIKHNFYNLNVKYKCVKNCDTTLKLISGEFLYRWPNGQSEEIVFNNGFLMTKTYTYMYEGKEKSTWMMKEKSDFTKMFNNQTGSFYYEIINNPEIIASKKLVTMYWVTKGKKRWKANKIK